MINSQDLEWAVHHAVAESDSFEMSDETMLIIDKAASKHLSHRGLPRTKRGYRAEIAGALQLGIMVGMQLPQERTAEHDDQSRRRSSFATALRWPRRGHSDN
jgi:hypothetical protein